MPIRIIDPNDKRYIDTDTGESFFYGEGYRHAENGIPDYERMHIHARLTASRGGGSVFVANDPGNSANETVGERIEIDFLGYEQEGENEGFFESFDGNTYSTKGSSEYNGIGIRSMDIKTDMGYITRATVVIVDARKGNLLDDSPYDILLSPLPSPIYTLTLKGYYGRALTYRMLLSSVPSVQMEDSGQMVVTIELVANIWKPLGEVLMYDLYSLPFLKDGSGGRRERLDLSSSTRPTSFYEFVLRGRKFYDDLIESKENGAIQREITAKRRDLATANALLEYDENYLERIPSAFERDNPRIRASRNFQSPDREYIFDVSPDYPENPVNELTRFYGQFLSGLGNAEGIARAGVEDPSILSINQNGTLVTVDFADYRARVASFKQGTENELDTLSDRFSQNINDAIADRFGAGFRPTAKAVMKLLCDDIDRYFNILRESAQKAESYHENNTPQIDNGRGGVDFVQPYPVYSVLDVSKSTPGKSYLAKTWPSNKPSWFEHRLVNDFYTASIYREIISEKAEESRKRKISDLSVEGDDIGRFAENDDFDIVKTELYYGQKKIIDKYIKPFPQNDSRFAYPDNGGTPLIDKFSFVDRSFDDIGDEMILDFIPILNLDLTETTAWSVMDMLLSGNGMRLFPFQNFMVFEDGGWDDAFEPMEYDEKDSTPRFICMYMGGNSQYVNSSAEDGFAFTCSGGKGVPPDMDGDNDVFAFRVDFGKQNQSYFKNIQASTTEYGNTRESIMLADDISRRGGKAIPSIQGQSLYDIYESYSYKVKVKMVGCMSVQPTEYFEICNVPIFWGVYMVTDVSHSVKGNNMETTFSGIRVGRYIKPIVRDFAKSVDVLYQSVREDYSDSVDGGVGYSDNQARTPRQLVRTRSFSYVPIPEGGFVGDPDEQASDYISGGRSTKTVQLGFLDVTVSDILGGRPYSFSNVSESDFS